MFFNVSYFALDQWKIRGFDVLFLKFANLEDKVHLFYKDKVVLMFSILS